MKKSLGYWSDSNTGYYSNKDNRLVLFVQRWGGGKFNGVVYEKSDENKGVQITDSSRESFLFGCLVRAKECGWDIKFGDDIMHPHLF